MKTSSWPLRLPLALLAGAAVMLGAPARAQTRPMELEDLFRLRRVCWMLSV
jgi:hypothetical protein